MTIKQYATLNVIAVSEDAYLHEAACLMKDRNVGCVIIVKHTENDLTPVGIITDRDILVKTYIDEIDPKKISVKDLVTQSLLIINQNNSVQETIKLLAEKGVRRAPIVNDYNKLVGVISLDDLFVLMAEELYFLSVLIKKQIA